LLLQRKVHRYINSHSGIDLYCNTFIRFIKGIHIVFSNSKKKTYLDAMRNLSKLYYSLKSLYTIYKRRPTRLKASSTTSSYSIMNVLLIPSGSTSFEQMANSAIENIVTFSGMYETMFLIVKFNNDVQELESTLRRYNLNQFSCKFYIFGHKIVGKKCVGTEEIISLSLSLRFTSTCHASQ